MAEITLRDIQLKYDGKTLTISSVEQPHRSVSLDPRAVEELVQFVHALSDVDIDPSDQSSQSPVSGRTDGANRREAFRVPVIVESGLEVSVTANGEQTNAEPTNISMTGVFVELAEGSRIQPNIGDELHVQLATDELSIGLDAVVRRKEKDGFGLFFPASIKGEHVNPPPVLRLIVMDLQRRWMMHRKDHFQ